ncbi:fibronectin type III domain-containing protein [Flavobacterium sp.]|uniref:fibronectin type III domain-containing protein n=1 Tax=Flavobacterium sp. TaxID=239 RepID=UPI003750D8E0
MNKHYSLNQIICIFLFLFSNLLYSQRSVTLELNGKYFINTGAYYPSIIKYRPVGGTTYTTDSNPVNYFGYYVYNLNPFVEWEFLFDNDPTPLITNHNYNSITKNIGYTYDFEGDNISEGWRGYHKPSVTGQHVYSTGDGTSNYVLLDWSPGNNTSLVSPKLSNISNDKKISFWVDKTYNNNSTFPTALEIGTFTNPFDQSTFHVLKTEYITNEDFYKVTVYLDNYNGTDAYIGIRGSGGNGGEVLIDNFSYEQSVHCADISNIQVNTIQEHSANLTFDTNQTLWEVELKNMISGVTSTFTVNQNNYTLQDLTGNTGYQVRVRSKCDTDHFSNWSTTVNFTTICNSLTAGYTTSFGEQQYYIDPCWKTITNVANVYQGSAGTPTTILPRTGSRMIEMTSGMGYSTDKKAYLITPYVQDLDNAKRIKFFLLGSGQYINNSLTIGTMSDPNNSDTFIPLKTISPEEMNEIDGFKVNPYWKEHIVYLDNYDVSNNHHYIALRQNFEDDGMFFIDDFTYENIPACKEPTNLTTLETDYNSVKVSWENYQNSSSEWQIEFGPRGFVQGSGTFLNLTTNLFTINSNLTESTEYDFYVRSKCGNIYSNWSDRGYFKTRCSGITTGYSNNFENENYTNDNTCWRRLTPSIRDSWYSPNYSVSFTSQSPGTATAHSGTKFLSHSVRDVPSETNEHEKTIAITPRLLNFNNYKKVSFWVYFPGDWQVTSRTFEVGTLSNPNDYTTFTFYKTITITEGFNQWKQITIDFPDYRRNDEYIGIRQVASNNYSSFFLDDFQYLDNNCPKATALKAVQINNNTATLSWQDNNTSFTTPSWDIEYGPIGFTSGTGTVVNATSNPFALNGLTENTEYEYRVKTNCGITNLSVWSEPYTFKIACVSNAPLSENFNQFDIENDPNWKANFCWTSNNNNILINPSNIGFEVPGNQINSNIASLNTGNTDPFGDGEIYKEHLISPFLSDFNNGKRVKFWATLNDVDYTQENQETVNLVIGTVSNPLDISTFSPFTTISLKKRDYLGKEFIVDFSAYTGSDKYFVFMHGDNTGNSSRIYIDNIQYDNIQPCIEPLNLNIKSVNSSQALIAWENTMSNPNLVLEYGLAGFLRGTGTIITVNNVNEKLITGLQENTNYDYYLYTQCSPQTSFIIGPKKFTTTCNSLTLPWIEKFDTVTTYGENLMPNCMKSDGVWESKDTPIDNWNSNIADFNGVDDTFYALSTYSGVSNMFTPSFNLSAGTTYTFSFYQQKEYQYASGGIAEVNVGLGNELVFMKNKLGVSSGEISIDMSQFKYHFTPIISGDYSFLLASWNYGGYKTSVDNLELKEGYINVINQDIFTTDYNFQSPNNDILLEATQNTKCEITVHPNDNSNSYVQMFGADNYAPTWVPETTSGKDSNDIWVKNQNHISKINFKIDANLAITNLYMSMDLKQTFRESNLESRFRLLVNGNLIGNVYLPQTSNSDIFTKIEFDLTPYIGQVINISIQHLGKNNDGIGDNAFVDNLKFTNSPLLSNNEYVFNSLNYYPNPVNKILNIENNSIISSIEIFTLTGQSIFNKNYSTNKVIIDTNNFASGVYFIKITSNYKNKTIKIIKE